MTWVKLFLTDLLTQNQFDEFMETRDLSLGGKLLENNLKGDEVELWNGIKPEDVSPEEWVSDAKWRELKLNYIGSSNGQSLRLATAVTT